MEEIAKLLLEVSKNKDVNFFSPFNFIGFLNSIPGFLGVTWRGGPQVKNSFQSNLGAVSGYTVVTQCMDKMWVKKRPRQLARNSWIQWNGLIIPSHMPID